MIRIIDHEGNGYGAQAEITRRKGVNGEKSLTGTIYTNDKVLNGVDRGWKLEFENELYAFIFALPKDSGNQIELEFDAVHEFFYDMSKSAQNNLLNDGSHTFKTYLDFIFNGTKYNYSLEVNVQAFEKQNFGQKNRLELFYDVIKTAGVEFSVSGSVVRILERVGNDLSTVVKKGFNLNELRLEKNIGDFVTYQKGFGAWNDDEDHSKGRLEVEYLSPLAKIYGKLDADPVVDERYTIRRNLLARLQNNVEGSYQISVQIDMEDLTRAGYEYKQPHEGDSIMAINDDLGFQRKVRIVSYETDFDMEGNILDHRITCNSLGIVEESILSNNAIKNSIKELQTDLEITRKQVIEFNVSADGKSTNYYGPIEPSPGDYKLRIGDTWFDSSGEDTIIKVWNGVEWRKSGLDIEAMKRQFEQVQQDITEAKQTADEAVSRIDGEIAGKFTDLDTEISLVHNDAQNALNQSGEAVSQVAYFDERLDGFTQTVANIDGRVANIRHDVDGITETVTDQTGKIATVEQNVNEIQQTVSDPVNGLVTQVSTLASGFNVLAKDFEDYQTGQLNILTHNVSDWELGDFNLSTGSEAPSNSRSRTKGYIPLHDVDYISLDSTGYGEFILLFYDKDKRFVGGSKNTWNNIRTGTYEVPAGTRYFRASSRYSGNNSFSSIEDVGIGTKVKAMVVQGTEIISIDKFKESNRLVQAQLSVLNDNINLRVIKGELLSQINIEAGRTLIQSDRLLLNANNTVITGTAWMDGAVIANASIDGAKIKNATIGSAKIINLDAAKITFGTLRGIRAEIDRGLIGGWNLESGGLYKRTPYGYTTLKPGGDVAIGIASPEHGSTTDASLQIWHDGTIRFGRLKTRIYNTIRNNLRIISHNRIILMADATVETDSRIIPQTNGDLNLGESTNRWRSIYSNAFRTANGVFQPTKQTGSNRNSSEIYTKANLELIPEGSVRARAHIFPWSSNYHYLGRHADRWKAVYTVGGVSESSDERLKKNIQKIDSTLLEKAEDIKPIMYEDQNGKINFGYSAQDVQRTLTKYAYQELGIRGSEVLEKFSALEKGESYLSLRYRDIEVMKGALRDKKIEELENRIKELENAS